MNKKNPLLRALPLLAGVLGNAYGIRVLIGGRHACTDGSVIRLPDLPAEADATFLGLVRGYIDHEAAHIRYTDFKCMQGLSDLERHIWNVFEDWRVENRLSELFPGCQHNFAWLIRHIFLKDVPLEDGKPGRMLLDWLLLHVRSWDVAELGLNCTEMRDRLDGLWPGFLGRIEDLLEGMREQCPDSWACLDYARKVVEIIRQTAGNGGSASEDPERSVEASRGGREEALRRLLQASQADLPTELGEILAESLETRAQGCPYAMRVATEGGRNMGPLSPEQLAEVGRATAGLRAKLHAALQGKRLRDIPARRGKVDLHRLHRVVACERRIFLRRGDGQGVSAAVHILLDCSGSMRKRIHFASGVCHAVAKTLALVGVNAAVTAFPAVTVDDGIACSVAPIVRHGQRVHSRFALSASGRTPMCEALWWTLQQMVPLKESRRIVLIITDGTPDDVGAMHEAAKAALGCGFELYGLGIDSPGIFTLLPASSVNIKEMHELAPAVFRLFGQALTRGI